MDLTGYKIKVNRNAAGLWTWAATDPEGQRVPVTVGTHGAFMGKENAEEAAVEACEDHASQPEEIDAEQLRQRLAQT